jgi:hypothetical protein
MEENKYKFVCFSIFASLSIVQYIVVYKTKSCIIWILKPVTSREIFVAKIILKNVCFHNILQALFLFM